MPTVARHVLVSGRVQGVGFRWAARAKGEEQAVTAMLAWLRRGPTAARVTAVEAVPREPEGLSGFLTRR
ncbi:MAG TPA: acylphosphatase [Planctomycetota bacterium]